jgi:hypothetical protein
MTFTIVSAMMTKDSTSREIMTELKEKVSKLGQSGWVCFGNVSYFVNGVSQAMVPATLSESEYPLVSVELTKHEANGTRKPKRVNYVDTCTKLYKNGM